MDEKLKTLGVRIPNFRVSAYGNLMFSCMADHPIEILELVIPKEIVLRGSAAVQEYILQIFKIRQAKYESEQAARFAKLESIFVLLSLTHGEVALEGAITLSTKKGWAVLDVTLHKPVAYAGVDTLYAEKYANAADKKLLTPELEPSCYAVREAKKLLVRIYETQRHLEKFAHVYAVLNELKGES